MPQPTIQQTFDSAVQHHHAGRLRQAEQLYRQILAQQPAHADALHMLGVLALQVGQNEVAIDLIRRAIALRPAWPEAHYNLGVVLKNIRQLDAAVASYRQALALKPAYPKAHVNLGHALRDQGQLDEAIAAYRLAMTLEPGNAVTHSHLVYTLLFHPADDAQALGREQRDWSRRHAEPLKASIQPHSNDRSPDRRLRVGYISPDFRMHVVGQFLLPLLAHHDKNQVEVFCYSDVPAPDAMTQSLRSRTAGWRNILRLSDSQAADLIRQDNIDILIDLTMHMPHNRLLTFARKPAPVQATYLAYCGSTGLETIDYRLSDPYLDPAGIDESSYSEQTLRLPETYWCYQPGITTPDAGPVPAIAQGRITFGCLNNFCKVSEPALAAWSGILRAMPGSQLLLHAHEGSHHQQVRERLARAGIEPERVRFAGFLPAGKYFDLYRQIDIALDTFPYGGGTTTCDALWMGVPVVSLVGKTAVGRGGLSILSNIGLPELAAGSEEQYVRTAIKLAGDLSLLQQLRSTLRQRMEQSPLTHAPRFARAMEAAYREMWRNWCPARD